MAGVIDRIADNPTAPKIFVAIHGRYSLPSFWKQRIRISEINVLSAG